MASLAEKYVFERLAMLEKEHDEHLKGSSVNVEKEAENSDGVEFKKEPIKAVRYTTCGSWCFEETAYGMGDIDALKSALELDDEGLYTWATKEYSGGMFSLTPIQRQEIEFEYQLIDTRGIKKQVYAAEDYSFYQFNYISSEPCCGRYCFIEHDDGAKEKAIADIRVSIKRAIDRLENGTDEEEEDSDE